jgi:hypothetical protein
MNRISLAPGGRDARAPLRLGNDNRYDVGYSRRTDFYESDFDLAPGGRDARAPKINAASSSVDCQKSLPKHLSSPATGDH